MLRTYIFLGLTSLAFILAAVVIGCGRAATETTPAAKDQQADSTADATSHGSDESHGHTAGAHGGTIVSLGSDSYHVEAIINDNGEIRLYTLGNDETRVIDVEAQTLAGYVKAEGSAESLEIQLEPQPQPGDKEGRTSLFVGKAPESLVGKSLEVTVPNITIEGERFRLHFTAGTSGHGSEHGEAMPEKVGTAEERALYLTPGGIYTAQDIAANGNTVASAKFKGLRPKHDNEPKPGEKICPISLTKANPEFTWIIAGKPYQFCCPPCVDEFVAMAKESPEKVKDPSEYVQD
jgi:hypothetical protein